MMLNSTVDSTIPIMKPILKKKCGKRSSSEKRVDRKRLDSQESSHHRMTEARQSSSIQGFQNDSE